MNKSLFFTLYFISLLCQANCPDINELRYQQTTDTTIPQWQTDTGWIQFTPEEIAHYQSMQVYAAAYAPAVKGQYTPGTPMRLIYTSTNPKHIMCHYRTTDGEDIKVKIAYQAVTFTHPSHWSRTCYGEEGHHCCWIPNDLPPAEQATYCDFDITPNH